jgi:type I restriction enzyme S subunit
VTPPAGWKATTLSQFVDLQRGFDLPGHKRVPGQYRVISSGKASGSHNEGPVKGPGFAIGRATNLGRPTWSDHDYWPLNTVLFVKDFRGNDPKFAYYLFENLDLSGYNSGSVQPMLNRNYIANVEINIPDVHEQRRIAGTLGVLDEKIGSARRSSGLIEELLMLEFKRVLTSNDVSEEPLSDHVATTKGVSYRSIDLLPSRTSLVTLKSVDRAGGYKADGLKPYVGLFKPSQVLQPGEIIVAQTDLTQGAEVVGRAVRVPAGSSADTLVASLDLVIVRPLGGMPGEYLQGILTAEAFRQYCRSRTSGTTVLHLAGDAIPTYNAPIVSARAQQNYSDFARPLIEQIDSFNREIEKLTAVRDGLLPGLMSGRIRVPEAGEVRA